MVGGAGTFGFDAVSIAARDVENTCVALVDAVEPPDDETRGRIDELVQALGRTVADGLGADGLGADGLGADGLGADGLGADGLGADNGEEIERGSDV